MVNVPIAECVKDPLVPITVSVYVPPALALHETVAVPDPEIVAGLIAPHVRPVGTASVRDTVPVKPFCAEMVMVELADWPTLTAEGEVAEIVKSGVSGPKGRNVSRQPHPMGLLLHCIAP
jgi:hypothetical protein